MATAMLNNVGSGSQRAGGSGSGIEPDEDSKQSSRTKSYASVAGTTGGPDTSASQATAVTGSGAKHECDKEKSKIGHRRVNERGEITFKKVTTNHLMGSIQLGIGQAIATNEANKRSSRIGQAIGTLTKYDERDLLMQDFMTVETTHFAKGGSSQTPAHPYSDFTFKTYAPLAFRYFLNLFGIKREDFLVSLCSKQMRELSNPGASGSIFYLTYDDEFILKTVQHKEAEFLQKLLPGYYMNLNQNPHTLLPKFFGMYIYQCNQKNIRIIVMNNLLPSNIKMHLKFDLKGSTFKRKANKSERAKSSPTFKDLDFMEILPEGLMLEAETYNALITTMRRDCRVLESFRIMDYSLLIGIHNLDQAAKEQAESTGGVSPTREQARREAERKMQRYTNKQKLVGTTMESIQAQTEPIDEQDHLPPGGIPARNHKGERLLIYLGIIDILQSYRMQKKLEHVIKSIIHDGDSVSVHRPGFYAHRFLDFMADKVFKKIPSLDLPEVSGSHRKFRSLVSSLIALKHSPSKRGKRESVKNSTSSKLENSNSPEAATTSGVGAAASNATSTTGPTPAAPNGGATTTQGTELGQLRGAAAIGVLTKGVKVLPTTCSPIKTYTSNTGNFTGYGTTSNITNKDDSGCETTDITESVVSNSTATVGANTLVESPTAILPDTEITAEFGLGCSGGLNDIRGGKIQTAMCSNTFADVTADISCSNTSAAILLNQQPETLNIPAVLWDRPTGSSKRVPPPVPPRSPRRPIDQMASFAMAAAASSEGLRGTRPDVVPGPSDTTDAPLPTFETFRNEPSSSSKYDGSRPKHKRQDQVKQLSYNHSSLGDLHCDYDTSSVNYGTPSHLSIGTSSLNTATWTEEAQPSFTDSSISGSLGRASADPAGRISKMETISSSNHVTSSSLGSRLNYNNSTPHRRTPSPRSPYTSAIITNIREDGKIERRLETCSYQETEM